MRIGWDWWMRSAGLAVDTPLDVGIGLFAMETNRSSEPASPGTRKKPYEKPSFRQEKVFVTTALACGKVSATQRSCRGSRRAS